MTRLQWLLTKVAEEAGELAKEALKAQQFGLDSKKVTRDGEFTNLVSMQLEFNDLLGVLDLLNKEIGQTEIFGLPELVLAKTEKLERYYELLKNKGSVE